MTAIKVTCQKGPALLARAGVTLSDAQWFYRRHRDDAVASDGARLASIRTKVQSFLALSAAPARDRLALA